MELQCQVQVINREYSSLNIRSNGTSIKRIFVLEIEPKNEKECFILQFSIGNRNETKYKIKCMKNVFVRCLDEGKVILRLHPEDDLCVIIQFQMRLLKSCVILDARDSNFTSVSNSSNEKDFAPTNLNTSDCSEFPIKGLFLHIIGFKLCNLRRDVLLFNHLVVLDLSNNEIEKIPAELGRMPNIRELHFANNCLGVEKVLDWQWLLGIKFFQKLELLDLSGNKLKELPKSIWKLQQLVTLKLDNNKLKILPATIARINSLRYLTVSKNQLQFLPSGLMQCQLKFIDLSFNNFIQGDKGKNATNIKPWDLYINSLLHISAKVVLNNKLFYAPSTIPWTLVDTLDNAHVCVCGRAVLNDSYFVIKEFKLKCPCKMDFFNYGTIGFQCFFCSPKCFIKG